MIRICLRRLAYVCIPLLVLSGLGFVGPLRALAHDGLHEQIVAVTKRIRRNPRDPLLYLKRAELYRLHAEWKRSEADFLTVERLDPSLVAVDLGRGKLWLDTKQFSKARGALDRYLLKQPDSFDGLLTMARVLAKLRNLDRSASYFSQAIDRSPADSAEIYFERAQMLAGGGKIDVAIDSLDQGIARLGRIIALQSAAVDLEVKRGRYDLALKRLDEITESMPRKESFLLRRGEILILAGKPCEAFTSLTASKVGFDNLPAARKNLRAVRTQKARLDALLSRPSIKNCPARPASS